MEDRAGLPDGLTKRKSLLNRVSGRFSILFLLSALLVISFDYIAAKYVNNKFLEDELFIQELIFGLDLSSKTLQGGWSEQRQCRSHKQEWGYVIETCYDPFSRKVILREVNETTEYGAFFKIRLASMHLNRMSGNIAPPKYHNTLLNESGDIVDQQGNVIVRREVNK